MTAQRTPPTGPVFGRVRFGKVKMFLRHGQTGIDGWLKHELAVGALKGIEDGSTGTRAHPGHSFVHAPEIGRVQEMPSSVHKTRDQRQLFRPMGLHIPTGLSGVDSFQALMYSRASVR